MQEILCMLIGAVIAIFTSFAVPEKYQEKFILGFSLLYVIIYVILKYDLFNIWDTIYYLDFVIVSIVALLSIIPLILRHSNMSHRSQVN